ncbi:XRN 5'-3' exonuclease N-terminus/Zn-finger in Ran binding protein and others, putative [Trypanosoma equiperdum]|uniref:XRN 5'-3' exonuclease N-terminus/Zn-finger in Ran binding protein and others, putative n=1 Tax=Trypanosoma equiperdum TaxID=5694 RepID=A0A1G4IDS3_TRYEQ|nr:XRN 5'-3' exonuclease N-terminus/Zn-finger in Ran binding protein and others, putative [Trypanosoma equiperdum]
MGVPKFASWLRNKYPAIVTKNCPSSVHGLYIDLNGIIHPCCHNDSDTAIALLPEEEKLECICSELELLVQTVQPKEVMYIAIDGVAPRAKMNQQRARRYMGRAAPAQTGEVASTHMPNKSGMAIVEEVVREFTSTEMAQANDDLDEVRQTLLEDPLYSGALHNEGEEEAGDALNDGDGVNSFCVRSTDDDYESTHENRYVESNQVADDVFGHRGEVIVDDPTAFEFDSNCISPGTDFMAKVSDAVLNMLNEKMSGNDPTWTRLCVIFSGSNTPGEGEHKIIDFLRTQSSLAQFGGKANHVIVGLDADLIFLALSLHITQVFILRDTTRNPYKRRAVARQQQRERRSRRKRNFIDDTCIISLNPSYIDEEESDGVIGVPVCESSENSSSDTDNESPIESREAHVATVPNTGFEYFDISVVGGSLISEVSALCDIKKFTPATESAFDKKTLVSSAGYYFFGQPNHIEGGTLPSSTECGSPKGRRSKRVSKKTEAERSWKNFRPCSSPANSKIIDDIIVLSILLGNDFLPHAPSAFSGESALDNLLELYVSEVLPYGFLTKGPHEINLPQLQRLFEAYAKIEAVKFRRFLLFKSTNEENNNSGAEFRKGSNNDNVTVADVAVALHSTIDDRWRDTYLKSTGLSNSVQEACEKYVEGVCFVWRYYTTTTTDSDWSWYYPFYHAPPVIDLAMYLKEANIKRMPLPVVKPTPPDTLVQLLSILPPTSHALLPMVLGEVMVRSPQQAELESTFPLQWHVDYHDSNVVHLATVMLPFADMDVLQQVVDAAWPQLTEEERWRTQKLDFHLVITSNKTSFVPKGDLRKLSDALDTILRRVPSREGVEIRQLYDVPLERYRPRTYSCTVEVPRLSYGADGQVIKRQRRHRHSGQLKGNGEGVIEGKKSNSRVTVVNKGPCFATFLLFLACASVFTAVVLLPCSLASFMQVLSINICAILISFVLGISVHDPSSGCGMSRNNIRQTFVDWLCTECLSLNFSSRTRCFVCRAPFDNRRCLAVFSCTQSADQSLYDPDHSPHIEAVKLQI